MAVERIRGGGAHNQTSNFKQPDGTQEAPFDRVVGIDLAVQQLERAQLEAASASTSYVCVGEWEEAGETDS